MFLDLTEELNSDNISNNLSNNLSGSISSNICDNICDSINSLNRNFSNGTSECGALPDFSRIKVSDIRNIFIFPDPLGFLVLQLRVTVVQLGVMVIQQGVMFD